MKRKEIEVDEMDEEVLDKKIKNEASLSIIIPGKLYLGDEKAAADLDLLKSHKITAVLNASHDSLNYHPK